ncbi:receptor-type protein kinase, putative [Bodo saltans]|uniref:Receptor-type protein kinase, putative n=1 Tax=Bodo saltans TaxID=75058 RepID=A0A0S4J420_BODSA|nr:receptor-type protein kinase, putative [Bodo saltans]|eukprot:CUG42085.1 receptor-type protein kinase, putative [Bodo saltans]
MPPKKRPRLEDTTGSHFALTVARLLLVRSSELTTLRTLHLACCDDVTATGLACVGALTSLQSLDMTGVESKLYYGLFQIVRWRALVTFPHYRTWTLGVPVSLTDEGIALRTLSAMQDLCLVNCNGITDVGLESVAALSQLIFLALVSCVEITDAGVASISSLPKPRVLDVSFCIEIIDCKYCTAATVTKPGFVWAKSNYGRWT